MDGRVAILTKTAPKYENRDNGGGGGVSSSRSSNDTRSNTSIKKEGRKEARKEGRKEGAERKEEWKKVDLVFARLTVAMVATYKVLVRTRRSQQHR